MSETFEVMSVLKDIALKQRVLPDMYDMLIRQEIENPLVKRWLLSRPYDGKEIDAKMERFRKDAVELVESLSTDESSLEETDIYLSFGTGIPLRVSSVKINRSMFVYNVNQYCRGLFFYKVVRNDEDNSIHFIQIKDCTEFHLRQLLQAMISSIAKVSNKLQAGAVCCIIEPIVKRTWGLSVPTIIKVSDDIFLKDVKISTEKKVFRAVFFNSAKFKSVETRVLEWGRIDGNNWFIQEKDIDFIKAKADAFMMFAFGEPTQNNFTPPPYEDIISAMKKEWIRVPLKSYSKLEIDSLWKEVVMQPEVSAWTTLFDKMKRDGYVRVVSDINYL